MTTKYTGMPSSPTPPLFVEVDRTVAETDFVVHHHIKGSETHFDLMIHRGDKLATWAFPDMPGDRSMEGRRLFDHRLRYLQFEGELSRSRGRTAIVDRGTCDVLRWDDKCIEAVFHGDAFVGRYFLLRGDSQSWTLSEELPE